MLTLPALTLAFSLNVYLMSFLLRSAVAVVLLFSSETSLATVAEAAATDFSKTSLDIAGFQTYVASPSP